MDACKQLISTTDANQKVLDSIVTGDELGAITMANLQTIPKQNDSAWNDGPQHPRKKKSALKSQELTTCSVVVSFIALALSIRSLFRLDKK